MVKSGDGAQSILPKSDSSQSANASSGNISGQSHNYEAGLSLGPRGYAD